MNKRLYSGSLLGMGRDSRHNACMNPFVRVFLDERVDEERLEEALTEALSYCGYMSCTVEEDEGIFLKLRDNEAKLPIQKSIPLRIDSPENNGHSCAVCAHDNMISVMVSHALTDGCGFFFFVKTLLALYFGSADEVYRGASQPDHDIDILEGDLSVADGYEPVLLPEGDHFTIADPVPADWSRGFCLQTSQTGYKALCKKADSSSQNVLSALSVMALAEAYPDNDKNITVRIPVNARGLYDIPDSFQNSSLANMRVSFTASEYKEADLVWLAGETAKRCMGQNTRDAVAYQYGLWKDVLLAESREERFKRIVPLLGKDVLLVSNLGRGIVPCAAEEHVTSIFVGAMMFPLMVYGVPAGDRMGFSGTDLSKDGKYKNALKTVLERMGLSIEEIDPATGKAI